MLRRVRESARTKLQRALREVVEEVGAGQREETAALRRELAEVRVQLAAETSAGVDRAVLAVRDMEGRHRRDLSHAAEVRAAAESEAFVLEHVPVAETFRDPLDTLRWAVGLTTVQGMVLEFGVATGTTLRVLAEGSQGRPVTGFDVFSGLPVDWRTGFRAGAFAQEQPPVVPGAEVVVGLFADTLPGFLDRNPGPVALLHVDCDLYEPAVEVLEQVGPRLVEGTVVVFDEYFNYPGWQRGEHAAWTEFVARTGTGFELLGYTVNHEQMVLRVLTPPRSVG